MINHARTLLMNVSGDAGYLSGVLGEEIIDPRFRELDLPTHLDNIRGIIFGKGPPDRHGLNYRVRQIVSLLHASRYEDYLTDLDPRITYLDKTRDDLYSDAAFQPITRSLNPTGTLYFSGAPEAPDQLGRLQLKYRIRVISGSTVSVRRLTPPVVEEISDYSLTNDLSNTIPLTGSGYSFRFKGTIGSEWYVDILLRPVRTLADFYEDLQALGSTTLIPLFGISNEEPYLTFRNLWNNGRTLSDKLCGIFLALIYRTEELRRRNG